jgi:hypothetical protein
MKPEEIAATLKSLFGGNAVSLVEDGSWQVETGEFRLIVLLSQDYSWLRILLPLMPLQEALPFLEQLLEANFDETQEVRYAIQENVLWGVYQHTTETLVSSDFRNVISRMINLHKIGLNEAFNKFIEIRIGQIIKAAKLQGQSMESTMQNLERFYAEGLMGGMEQTSQGREAVLNAWRYQLKRMWSEIN